MMPDIHLNTALPILGVVGLFLLVEIGIIFRLASTAPDVVNRRDNRHKAKHWMSVAVFLIAGIAALWMQFYMVALWLQF